MFPLLQDYSNSVVSYYLHSLIPSYNVNHAFLTPTINPINESLSEFRFNQMNCNISEIAVVLEKSGFLYFNNASLNTTSRVFRNSQPGWVNQIALSTVSQNARSRVFRNLISGLTGGLSLAHYQNNSISEQKHATVIPPSQKRSLQEGR